MKRGFTLLELIVTIGILTASSLILVPIAISQIQQSSLESIVKDVSSQITVVQQKAYTGKNNTNHGIAVHSNRYEIFEGNSLADSAVSEEFSLPGSFRFSSINIGNGTNEFNFEKGNFKPDATVSLTMTDGLIYYQITINSEGLVDYSRL